MKLRKLFESMTTPIKIITIDCYDGENRLVNFLEMVEINGRYWSFSSRSFVMLINHLILLRFFCDEMEQIELIR